MNPNSQYYLSFNLGFPNRLESALGYSGSALMVHGACSSAGCYAMTDEGVAEIYAVAREALEGGQRAFQVQAYPFRMTAENLARHRNDPEYAFWTNLKQGYDLFEATKQPVHVGYCGRAYTFAAAGSGELPQDPLAACPPAIAGSDALVASHGETSSTLKAFSYSDGGMHPVFRSMLERNGAERMAKRTSLTSVPISRPDAALADPYKSRIDHGTTASTE